MARMMEALKAIAPNTVRKFCFWLMEQYGVSPSQFEEVDFPEVYETVKRYFGYSLTIDQSFSRQQCINDIKRMFSEYEDLMNRHPNGIFSIFGKLNAMSNQEREAFLEKHSQRVINMCLHHAIVKGYVWDRPSLKDALKTLEIRHQKPIFAEILQKTAPDTFWEDIKIKNTRINEVVPF